MGENTYFVPDQLFGAGCVEHMPGKWAVAVTKPGMDFKFCRKIIGGSVPGVGYFAPQETVYVSRHATPRPLFPGYVFVRGGEIALSEIKSSTQCLLTTLPVVNQDGLTRELMSLEVALASGMPLQRAKFTPGMPVLVTTGPMMGAKGVVLSHDGRDKLVINVTLLGSAVMVELNPSMVEAAA